MTAALSHSPPAQRDGGAQQGRLRRRHRAACRSCRLRLSEDQFGVLQGLRNMRLRRKIPRQHLVSLGVHHGRICRGLARDREERSGTSRPRLSANDNALGERRAVVLQDQVERKLGAAGVADPADLDPLRAENVQDLVPPPRSRHARRQSAPSPIPRAPRRWCRRSVPRPAPGRRDRARFAMSAISPGAQVVVQIITVGQNSPSLEFVEHGSNLLAH